MYYECIKDKVASIKYGIFLCLWVKIKVNRLLIEIELCMSVKSVYTKVFGVSVERKMIKRFRKIL